MWTYENIALASVVGLVVVFVLWVQLVIYGQIEVPDEEDLEPW